MTTPTRFHYTTLDVACHGPPDPDLADMMPARHINPAFTTDTCFTEIDRSSSAMLQAPTGCVYMRSPGPFHLNGTSMRTFLPDSPFGMHPLCFDRIDNEHELYLTAISLAPSPGLSCAITLGQSSLSRNSPPPFAMPSDLLFDKYECDYCCRNIDFEAFGHSSASHFLPSPVDDAVYADQGELVHKAKPISQIDTDSRWYGYGDQWEPSFQAAFANTLQQHTVFQRRPTDSLEHKTLPSREHTSRPRSHVAEYDAQMKYLAEKLRQARKRKHAPPTSVSSHYPEAAILQATSNDRKSEDSSFRLSRQPQNNKANGLVLIAPRATMVEATHSANYGSQNTNISTLPLQHVQQGYIRRRGVSATQSAKHPKQTCIKRKGSPIEDIASPKSASCVGAYKARVVSQMVAATSAQSLSKIIVKPSLPQSQSVHLFYQLEKQILTHRNQSHRCETKAQKQKGAGKPPRDIYADPMHHTATGPRRFGEHVTGYGPEKAKLEPGIVLSLVPMVTLPCGGATEIARHYCVD